MAEIKIYGKLKAYTEEGKVADASDIAGLSDAIASSLTQAAIIQALGYTPGTSNFSGAYADLTGKPSLATVATSGSYNDLSDKPSTVSTFRNDAGYITSQALSGYATQNWVQQRGYITGITKTMVTTALGYTPGTSNFSGNYNDLSNKPTNVSAFTNDMGYINHQTVSIANTMGYTAGWFRVARISSGTQFGAYYIQCNLLITGSWSYSKNTTADIVISTVHTTIKATQINGEIGDVKAIRFVRVNTDQYYIDVYIDSNGDHTRGDRKFTFIGNVSVTNMGASGNSPLSSSESPDLQFDLSDGIVATSTIVGATGKGLKVYSQNTGAWCEGLRIYQASNNYAVLALVSNDNNDYVTALVHNSAYGSAYLERKTGNGQFNIGIPEKTGTIALDEDLNTYYAKARVGGDSNYSEIGTSFIGGTAGGPRTSNWEYLYRAQHRNGSGDGGSYIMEIVSNLTSDSSIYWRKKIGGDFLGWRTIIDDANISSYAIMNAGDSPNLNDGTAITQPGGEYAISIKTPGSAHDTGIFRLSADNAYICNSSDIGYTFGVFDTDLTRDFSGNNLNAASFVVLKDGSGCKIRGNRVLHSGNTFWPIDGNALYVDATSGSKYALLNFTSAQVEIRFYSSSGTLMRTKTLVGGCYIIRFLPWELTIKNITTDVGYNEGLTLGNYSRIAFYCPGNNHVSVMNFTDADIEPHASYSFS